MKRFKPYACFAFKGGDTENDDPTYYELNHYGAEWGIDGYGEWMSRETIYVWDDCIYRRTDSITRDDFILEDGDEFVPKYRISLEEYMKWRQYIYNTRERIIKLVRSNIKPADCEPHIGECRCHICYFEDSKEVYSYNIYKIGSVSNDFCESESHIDVEIVDISFYKNFFRGCNSDMARQSYIIDERIYNEVMQLYEDMRHHLSTEIQHIIDNREAEYPYLNLQ